MANARLGWFSPLGVAASIRASAGRVGLRAHRFRFSARTASELPLGGLAFGLTASAFRHAPLRSGCWASSFFRLPLRRFPSAGWPSDSRLPLFGTHRFGDCHLAGWPLGSPLRKFRSAGWPSGSLLPLFGTHRFGDCHLAGWPLGSPLRKFRSAGWPSGSLLPLFGTHRFGVAAGRVRSSAFRFGDCPRRVGLRAHCFRFSARTASEWPPGGLAFGLTASAFRHAPLRKLPSVG